MRVPVSVMKLAPVLLVLVGVACEQPPSVPEPSAEGETTAFIGVNVLPMDRERVLANHTVLVRGQRIVALGPAGEVDVPAEARRIEAAGRYLVPGLAEMHGHLPNPDTPPELTENALFLYVANGVTTVRGMQGHPSQIALRERIESGELIGPRLYLGSPSMSGNAVSDPEQAARLVREYHETGFDLIKVHEGLSREVYDAIASTANEIGMPFAGHVTDHVGLFHALDSGQSTIDHLDNYVEALVPESEQPAEPLGLRGVGQLVDRVDLTRVARVVEATKQADAGVVPTMVLWESGIFPVRPSEELVQEREEIRYAPPDLRENWTRAVDESWSEANAAVHRRIAELRREIFQALHRGGARILLGTDSPQIFSVPGFSIHREMKLYVELGMTTYEVLEAGTRKVAEHFGAEGDYGTIEVGRIADLILVRGNPLEEIGSLAAREGVMVRGRFLSESEIDERLAAIAASYDQPSEN